MTSPHNLACVKALRSVVSASLNNALVANQNLGCVKAWRDGWIQNTLGAHLGVSFSSGMSDILYRCPWGASSKVAEVAVGVLDTAC